MKVNEIMTRDPKTAQLDSTLEEIAALMKDEDVGAIPIVDDDDELVGIVTDRDIVVRCVAEGKEASDTTVEDILTEELTTIEPDADVQQAARLMAEKQIRRLPVVQDGDLIGMVSIGDISVKHEDDETAGELHDRMKIIGADLLVKTIQQLAEQSLNEINQSTIIRQPSTANRQP